MQHPQKPLFPRSKQFALKLQQTMVDGGFRRLRAGVSKLTLEKAGG